ncbi:MAG: type II secretion system F family protein [Deltaproteobacteria bacterium]|nr:type II secretion system F family protein [Deltaproteobacteria bacterium]
MLYFDYTGISSGKYVTGEVKALNQEEAAFKLKNDKIIITKLIKSKKKVVGEKKVVTSFDFGSKTKVPAKEVMIFTKQFATMMKAGLPVLNILIMLEEQIIQKNLKRIVGEVKKDLESGIILSKSFEKHPAVFDNIYVNLTKAGEASGKLDIFLERIVIGLEKREKIKSKIKSALFYPATLFTVAIAVTIFMLINVVPVFVKMYQGMGAALPAPTVVIIGISNFIRSPFGGGLLLVSVIAGIFIFRHLIKTNYEVRKKWHRFVFNMPIFGNLIQKSIFARIALVLGNLNQAGVNLIESIDIAKSITTNTLVIEGLDNIKKGVFSGESLTKLFNREKVFPQTFAQLISVGEQTGSLDDMFGSIARYYEEEFDVAVSNLSSLIEPIMIVFMGLTIGGLMVAMYAPIFNVGALIK